MAVYLTVSSIPVLLVESVNFQVIAKISLFHFNSCLKFFFAHLFGFFKPKNHKGKKKYQIICDNAHK